MNKANKQFFINKHTLKSRDLWKLRAMFLISTGAIVEISVTDYYVFCNFNIISRGATKIEAIDNAIKIMNFTGI